MDSSIAAKITALIEAVKEEGFDAMPVDERRHLAALLRYIAGNADPDRADPDKPVTSENVPEAPSGPDQRRT
jgi:hypothetical protein